MTFDDGELTLYTYFRAQCATRVRIAAAIKGIQLKFAYVNLLDGAQHTSRYVSQINPSATVPTLVVRRPDGSAFLIRQSVSILEFFEEAFPDRTPLLPPSDQPLQRARVRDLVSLIAIDYQPKVNLSMLRRVEAEGVGVGVGVDKKAWCQEHAALAFGSLEALLQTSAGTYAVGDSLTLADVLLAPAVESALRWHVRLDSYPVLKRVYDEVKDLAPFLQADWRHQADTPESLRADILGSSR